MSRTEESGVHGADSVVVTLIVLFIAMVVAYFGWWAPNHPISPPGKPPTKVPR